MGPVKQTSGSSLPPMEMFRYLPQSVAMAPFDIAQLLSRMAAQDDGPREGGNSGKFLTKDINGNPAEWDGSPQQMREAHHLDDKSSTLVSVSGGPGSSGADNHEMGHTQGEDYAAANFRNRKNRRNKRNARQQGVEVHPDKDESYVGNVSDVDNLVKYINNDISAEKVKQIDGSPGQAGQQGKVPKKKDRNKAKTPETPGLVGGGSLDASDSPWVSSPQSESSSSSSGSSSTATAKPAEPADSLDDKDRGEMGNSSSSAEKQDTKEEETVQEASSSKIFITESETKNNNNKKMLKSELVKQDSSKAQKNHVVPSSKAPATTKSEKSTGDKMKPKDSDVEDSKVKNAKKGKSKPAKKDSQESQNRVISPPPPLPPSPSASYNKQMDVTDPSQGPWCTVEKKKSQKKRSQAQTVPAVQNCYTPMVNHQARSKDLQTVPSQYPVDSYRRGGHYNNAPLQQPPSVKSLCHSPSYFKAMECEKREKDLSPSDFPVLNSSPREYRRSLENVFDTGALISDKDSDKESSKSFPADLGLAGRCRATFTVSYASMASGHSVAQESVDSSKAASVTSSVEDPSVEFSSSNSTSLKWKGSPQERRHSIGSAPKELSKNVVQRTGSQEMLHCDTDLRSPTVTIPNKVSNSSCKTLIPSDSTGSFSSSDADSARGSEVGSEGLGEELPAASADNNSSSGGSRSQHRGMSAESKKTPASAEEKLATDVVNAASEQTPKTTKSIPVEHAHSSQTVKKKSKTSSSSGAKQASNGQKKGVEFFCNGNEHFTPIHDLQFGFFPDEEEGSLVVTSSVPTGGPVAVGSKQISQPAVVAVAASGERTTPQPGPADSVNSHSSSSSAHTSAQQVSSAAGTDSSSASRDGAPKNPPKGPHIAGLNGFISPPLPVGNTALVLQTSSPSSSVHPEQTSARVESTGPGSQLSHSASSVSQDASRTSSQARGDEGQDDKIRFMYGGALLLSPEKAMYRRPPDEIATSHEMSHDYFVSLSFLGSAWEYTDGHGWTEKHLRQSSPPQ